MAEELLIANQQVQSKNGKVVPMIILRPSIMAASLKEPVPGWTDRLGFLGSFHAIAGHGILKDLPLNPKLIGDQIPVDLVANQLLASILVLSAQTQKDGTTFLLTHSSSSAANGVTWGETINAVEAYWENEPLEQAISKPQLTAHTNQKSYEMAFKLKSELPALGYYYMTKILGSKQTKKISKEYKKQIEQCKIIGSKFSHFMNNEWIFDNASTLTLASNLKELDPSGELSETLNFDVSQIKWKPFCQNHAYGIKRYIL